jgi:hypothetical protein
MSVWGKNPNLKCFKSSNYILNSQLQCTRDIFHYRVCFNDPTINLYTVTTSSKKVELSRRSIDGHRPIFFEEKNTPINIVKVMYNIHKRVKRIY